MTKILFILSFFVMAQTSYTNPDEQVFQSFYGVKSKSAYSDQHKFSRNEITSFLYKFYGIAGKITKREEIMPYLNQDSFYVNVKILKREFTGADKYVDGLFDLREKYPTIDRYIDKVDVTFLEPKKYQVKFRLTSQLYDENDKFLATFRARLTFEYLENDSDIPTVTKYLATPSLKTIPLTIKEKVKHFFKNPF
ncbi:MAG: hypothetical protein KC646_03665 [Candidatus Cloacimonetes bacterium]|nr:hypothetical protein [Candidatus Cloacimonadota bacterium]